MLGCVLLVALGWFWPSQGAQQAVGRKEEGNLHLLRPDLRPRPLIARAKALEILKAASSRLAAAQTVKFTAIEFFESSSRHGHPLSFTTKSEVTLQRPDKLRVMMSRRWTGLGVPIMTERK